MYIGDYTKISTQQKQIYIVVWFVSHNNEVVGSNPLEALSGWGFPLLEVGMGRARPWTIFLKFQAWPATARHSWVQPAIYSSPRAEIVNRPGLTHAYLYHLPSPYSQRALPANYGRVDLYEIPVRLGHLLINLY